MELPGEGAWSRALGWAASAGVEVGVNWSWLVVFALITWSLASGVFPSQDPGHSDGT